MKVYKITDKNNYTRSGKTLWGENVTRKIEGKGEFDLLPSGIIRCYRDPYLAVFMSPVYDKYNPMKLWEAETPIIIYDDLTISDVRELTTIKEIPLPELAIEQRVMIAAKCALKVCREGTKLYDWSGNWVTGENRNSVSAWNTAIDAKATNPIVWRSAGAAALLGNYLENYRATDGSACSNGIRSTNRVFTRIETLAAEAAILTALALGDDMGDIDIIDTIHHVIDEDNHLKSLGNVKEKVDVNILMQNLAALRNASRDDFICTGLPGWIGAKPAILHFLENIPCRPKAATVDEIVKHLSADNPKYDKSAVWIAVIDLKTAGKVTISRAPDSNAKVVKLI